MTTQNEVEEAIAAAIDIQKIIEELITTLGVAEESEY